MSKFLMGALFAPPLAAANAHPRMDGEVRALLRDGACEARFPVTSSRPDRAWHTLHAGYPACAPRGRIAGRRGNRMDRSNVPVRDAAAQMADTLLSQVAGRDQKAFEALYRLTSARLLGIGMRVLGDRAEAEDVLQDVYIAVWDKAIQFDAKRSSAMTWLGTIARNRAIDRLRATPSPVLRAPVELIENLADPAPSPAAHADASSERMRLDECIGRLEPRGQTLIRTAFFEGATYDELAARTGSPLGSVKSWIRRGLIQLRECLGQ
jgi:RNA polymerase sigma-70 factor (ECF subfamily)